EQVAAAAGRRGAGSGLGLSQREGAGHGLVEGDADRHCRFLPHQGASFSSATTGVPVASPRQSRLRITSPFLFIAVTFRLCALGSRSTRQKLSSWVKFQAW